MKVDYEIKHIEDKKTLERVYAANKEFFLDSVLEVPQENYKIEDWVDRLKELPELMLYAEKENEICAIVFARKTSETDLTIGPVSTSPKYRRCGIASALLKEIEYRAKAKGFKVLALGTGGGLKISPAEKFYLSCGFVPNLFIQAKNPITLDELRILNKKYDEIWAYTGDNDIRLMLHTPKIDKEFEAKYKINFPDCNTQTLFTKQI